MMSFWKNLFGGGGAKSGQATASVEYNGFTIRPEPYLEGGQYQTAGFIEKDIDGMRKSHRFVRADRYPTMENAVEFTVLKAKQMIDLQGDKLFG